MSEEKAEVIDFMGKRSEQVEKKRRNFERLLFKNFLGSYSVIDDASSIYQISLVDISTTGCLFQIPSESKDDGNVFEKDKEINLRMYFTQTSYLPVIATIKYSSVHIDEEDGREYRRYGCEFDQSVHSFKAVSSFVSFLSDYAEGSIEDNGESKQVYFL